MDERIARPEGQSAASGNAVGQMPMSVMESLNRGKDAIGDVAAQTMRAAGTDLQMLRNDLNSLKDTLSRFMIEASTEAMKSARAATSAAAVPAGEAASGLTDKGTQMVSTAGEHVKTFGGEFESMVRRNPLGALAGAVAIGVLIGAVGRRR
jgi:ElaB/YqjD/DUF883 family membrane-anchored ribosome-binding protein